MRILNWCFLATVVGMSVLARADELPVLSVCSNDGTVSGTLAARPAERFRNCQGGRSSLATSCTFAGVGASTPVDLPWRSGVSALTNGRSQNLSRAECLSLELLCTNGDGSLARVQCAEGAKSGRAFWVNSETLACVQDNIANYRQHDTEELQYCPSSPLPDVPRDTVEAVPSIQACALKTAHAAYMRALNQSARQEALTLQALYQSLPEAELKTRLLRSRQWICGQLSGECSGARGQMGINCAMLAHAVSRLNRLLDPVELGPLEAEAFELHELEAESLSPERQERLSRPLTAQQICGRPAETTSGDPSMVAQRFKQYYGPYLTSSAPAATLGQAAFRQILYSGLDEQTQGTVKQRGLRMVTRQGHIHNGYILGGSNMTGNDLNIDCSRFIGYIYGLPRLPNTEALINVARELRNGRATSALASCFERVDLRHGQEPLPGDLVVQRANGSGHVVLVQSYDRRRDPIHVQTYEAFGNAPSDGDLESQDDSSPFGTIAPFRRPLFEPACFNQEGRALAALRSDIEILRFSPRAGCEAKPLNLQCD